MEHVTLARDHGRDASATLVGRRVGSRSFAAQVLRRFCSVLVYFNGIVTWTKALDVIEQQREGDDGHCRDSKVKTNQDSYAASFALQQHQRTDC